MRRISTIILALTLCTFISGCAVTSAQQIETTPLPTSTPEPEPTPEPSCWSLQYYVDDFGDETDTPYLRSDKITGTFSNTATNGSILTVYVYYDSYSGFGFRLLEYGDKNATHLKSENPDMLFKIDDRIHYLSFKKTSSLNSDLYLSDADYMIDSVTLFKNTLIAGESFPCIINIGSSEYSFTIDGTGFADALSELEATGG